MKIGTNWSTGRATSHSLSPLPSRRITDTSREGTKITLTKAPTSSSDLSEPLRGSMSTSNLDRSAASRPTGNLAQAERPSTSSNHLIALSGRLILVAYPDSPLLHVHASFSSNNPSFSSAGASEDTSNDHPRTSFVQTPHSIETSQQPIALIPPPPGWSSPSHPNFITAIAVDEGQVTEGHLGALSHSRVVLFYQSGGFVILSLPQSRQPRITDLSRCDKEPAPFVWTRSIIHVPPASLRHRSRKRHYIPPPHERVVLAALNGEMVVGVTKGFYLNIWKVTNPLLDGGAGEQNVTLVQTLHSAVAHWPASVGIKSLQDESVSADDPLQNYSIKEEPIINSHKYQIDLGYCSPIYPTSWKPCLQTIHVCVGSSVVSDTKTDTTIAQRVVRRIPPRIELFDPIQLAPSYRDQWPNGNLVTITSQSRGEIVSVRGLDSQQGARCLAMDSEWLALAGEGSLVEIYRLGKEVDVDLPGPKGNRARRRGQERTVLRHSHSLLTRASQIDSVVLRDGKCVTSGNDGKLLVWDLGNSHFIRPEWETLGDATMTFTPSSQAKDRTEEILRKADHVEVRSKATNHENTTTTTRHDSYPEIRQKVLPVPPLTHSLSLASAAQELMLAEHENVANGHARWRVRNLKFDQDKIVGLVDGSHRDTELVRVWTFDH